MGSILAIVVTTFEPCTLVGVHEQGDLGLYIQLVTSTAGGLHKYTAKPIHTLSSRLKLKFDI